MFLYLSKLLPLFVYPLGLSCLLLLLSLGLLWRRPRWAAVAIATALLLLLLSSNGWVSNQLVKSLEWRYRPDQLPEAEAIVVLGGGIKPAIPPRPWVDVAEAGDRVLYGAQLFKAGKAPLLVLSGGRISWQGGGPPESGDMAAIATAFGVPQNAILQDPASLNTYENAVNVRGLLAPRQIQRILLVTSAMHMPRSMAIFQRQGFQPIAAPTDFLVTQQELRETRSGAGQLLNLIPQSDSLDHFTRALKEYIGTLVYRLRGWL